VSEKFEVTSEVHESGTCILSVVGRLDAHTAAQLLKRCRYETSPQGRLVLNLAAVPFIASSGVGALLALAEEHRQSGGELRIAEPSEAVASVVRLLNLDQFLPLDATVGEALSHLKAA